MIKKYLEKLIFLNNLNRIIQLNKKYQRFDKVFKKHVPNENTSQTYFDKHYVYHIAWAIRKLKEINPQKHIDISSSLYFSVTASAYYPIEFYDIRPPQLILDNLEIKTCDITQLPFEANSIESLSCMHVVEHIGLTRYGDAIDYDGDLKAINELKRVLKRGGKLLFVVPVGNRPIIFFNAHRIYTLNQIKNYFNDLIMKDFCFITSKFDGSGLISNPFEDVIQSEHYGCGCFLFEKP